MGISLWLSFGFTLSNKVLSSVETVSVRVGGSGISIGLGVEVLGLGNLDGKGVSWDNSTISVGHLTSSGMWVGIERVSKEVLCVSLRLSNCKSSKNEKCNLKFKEKVNLNIFFRLWAVLVRDMFFISHKANLQTK